VNLKWLDSLPFLLTFFEIDDSVRDFFLMSRTICLLPTALGYPEGGGQLWVYLNWALALHALGFKVIWLELVWRDCAAEELRTKLRSLRKQLTPYGFADRVAHSSISGDRVPDDVSSICLSLDDAARITLKQ
jgi:hypothetical protein